jgi:hypothetical protein
VSTEVGVVGVGANLHGEVPEVLWDGGVDDVGWVVD